MLFLLDMAQRAPELANGGPCVARVWTNPGILPEGRGRNCCLFETLFTAAETGYDRVGSVISVAGCYR